MKNKKYFFFDIDGTIAVGYPREIPKTTERTLYELIDKGHFVSIATGRMYSLTREFSDKFNINTLVTDGGNGVVIDGELELEPMDRQGIEELILAFEAKGIPWSVCLSEDKIWTSVDERFPNAMKEVIQVGNYMEDEIDPNLDIKKVDSVYKAFAFLTPKQEKEITELKNIAYTRYNDNYIIIEPDDKSKGIDRLKELMGIEDEDIVVFGDNTNDVKMFKPEWTSIAMGNAVQKLKDVADFVTKDADDDGIEYACRHFGWID